MSTLRSFKAELPLADSLERLRLALAASNLGDWGWNAESDLVTLSARAAEIFGLPDQREISWSEMRYILHEDDRERVRLEVERSIKHHHEYDVEYRILVGASPCRWVSVKGKALYDCEGRVTGMIGVVYDITERKRLEEAQQHLTFELKNRLAEWQSLFDTAPIAIWLAHDPQCKVVTGNHYTNAILGVPNGTNISRTPSSNNQIAYEIWQDGRPVTKEEFPLRIACFQGIPVRNCEQEVRTPDGRRVSVLINAVPLYNEKQEIRGALATGLDITERKKTEQALRDSEERFRRMADASPALIWMAAPNKLFTWVNRAWLDFVGKRLTTQLGDGWAENVHPHDLNWTLERFQNAFEKREPFEVEFRLKRADGQYRWLLTKGRPLLGTEKEFTGFIGSCVDVTENKLRRDELEGLVAERTAKLKESIAHLEAFSYTVSHDMRAPLRGMEGFSQALLEDYGDKLDETGRDYLRRIILSAQKMDLLIEHVLSYSRVATGKVSLEPVDLKQVIAEVVSTCPELSCDKVNLTISLNPSMVTAAYPMLLQIFSNLLSNAAKFVPPGIRPEIHVTSVPDGAMVKIIVRDNGIGIHPEHHQRIFDIFSRLHSEHEYEGTGIGLAIVKKAVQMLGGEIGLDSTFGQGCEFWFTLKPYSSVP